MTRSEAIRLMEEGKKLTHRFFTPDEWVTINENGQYQFEDGIVCSRLIFWVDRNSTAWDSDWELFIEPSK